MDIDLSWLVVGSATLILMGIAMFIYRNKRGPTTEDRIKVATSELRQERKILKEALDDIKNPDPLKALAEAIRGRDS
jgi:hypothetical protein